MSVENKRDIIHDGHEKRAASCILSIIALARQLQARERVISNGAEDK